MIQEPMTLADVADFFPFIPTYRYYSRDKMRVQYGFVTDYVAPHQFHPDSFMSECNTAGSGTKKVDLSGAERCGFW